MRYRDEIEIKNIVESFEKATISRDEWRHAEHLIVAFFYVYHYDFDKSLEKMRDGIFKLLRAFEVDLSKEMPYHETLTVFWLRTVSDFARTKSELPFVEVCNELVEKYDKDYPLKFYTRELLFSDEARLKYIEANINDLKIMANK